MAWNEWEQLKAAAANKPTQMQLNGIPEEDRPNAGSPTGDLAVTQKDLAAIGDEAFKLYNRLWEEARVTSTDTAATDLKSQGFELGGALSAGPWISKLFIPPTSSCSTTWSTTGRRCSANSPT
ncbi:hypothetical protein ACFXKF_12720 [Streptomyces scopuliridis]|uniref:hypothetical protein n=1 Tax=Streptomyces scopuliridis TaxID=452529 RepID=UPI0036B70265